MKKRSIADAIILTVALALLLGAGGCTRVKLEDVKGPRGITIDRPDIGLDGAEKLDARIEVPAGEFVLHGEGSKAFGGEIRRSRDWEPRIEYSMESSMGVLRVDQSTVADIRPFKQDANEWDVTLPTTVPVYLKMELGAGESTLDLRNVDVHTLEVNTGVGQTTIDLSGQREHDMMAQIEAGVGQLVIRVPEGVGVQVEQIGGSVGELDMQGFRKEDGMYRNDAYEPGKPFIHVNVKLGIGEVEVVQVR